MTHSNLINLHTEAAKIDSQLTKLSQTDEEIHALYRGIQVWFSPLVKNPKIMFLGINPGAGFYNHNNHQLVHSLTPLEINEYVDPNQDYDLKWEWQYVFGPKGLNRLDLLEKSVKTNFCYLATDDEKAMKKLFTQIRGKLGIAPYEVFGNWTRQWVSDIHPKILICEGSGALGYLKNWSFKDEYVCECQTDSMEKGVLKNIKNCDGDVCGDITVLRFGRNRSKFKNIETVKDEIGKYL
ncbi:MAG: hypothetical protein SPI86_01660 [Treponemataceae bacterium]|nr:hypothetical protein [Spirochaetales bacterium]MDY6030446.1 hypothetical protein [Treponemataceae bacterium]